MKNIQSTPIDWVEKFKNESTADYIDRHIVEAMVETAKQKMYSEEEVITLLQQYRYDLSLGNTPNIGDTTRFWFEQFKKK